MLASTGVMAKRAGKGTIIAEEGTVRAAQDFQCHLNF